MWNGIEGCDTTYESVREYNGRTGRWTTRQTRAVELALALVAGRRQAGDLDDSEWWLLLLAAGINNHCAKPGVAARRVLGDASRHAGYFER